MHEVQVHNMIQAQVSCSSLSFLKGSDHAASQSAPSHTIANGLACISLSPTVRLAMLAEVIYIYIDTYNIYIYRYMYICVCDFFSLSCSSARWLY